MKLLIDRHNAMKQHTTLSVVNRDVAHRESSKESIRAPESQSLRTVGFRPRYRTSLIILSIAGGSVLPPQHTSVEDKVYESCQGSRAFDVRWEKKPTAHEATATILHEYTFDTSLQLSHPKVGGLTLVCGVGILVHLHDNINE